MLRVAITCAFVVGFSGVYADKDLWACGGSCGSGDGHGSHETGEHVVQAKAEVKGEKAGAVKDPVCGMEVADIKKASSEEYQGKVYYFCSDHCKKAFKKDPSAYTSSKAAKPDKDEGHKH
jgi:YHS domain-containing protein